MIKKIESKNMGSSNLGWLKSKFHFSFAEYHNPQNMRFGVLRVLNDDLIAPNNGFEMHPHNDMEIISYIIDGELTHGDSMGNKSTLKRGHVQYMSAGTGILHSEHNLGDSVTRLMQIWIFPDKKGYKPNYGEYRFDWEERKNRWLHMVSDKQGNGAIKINQDANLFALELSAGNEIDYNITEGRQVYLVQIEGESIINNLNLNERDAMEIVEENIKIKAKSNSHFILIDIKK